MNNNTTNQTHTQETGMTQPETRAAMRRIITYNLMFYSGMAGLIYEISWSRQIGLLFGHTAQAAAVVLGCYFAGVALGYIGATRVLHRIQRPLRGYAIAEWTVALWALVTPWLLAWFSQPSWASLLNASHPALQTLLRVVLSFVLLLPATIALGATLPFVAEYLSPAKHRTTRWVTRAYAWNTTGAVVGVIAATGFLLLFVGVRKSSYIAACLSLLCGAAAWFLGKEPHLVSTNKEAAPSQESSNKEAAPSQESPNKEAAPSQESPKEPKPAENLSRPQVSGLFWLGLAALSGFGVLALEVLYARLFALIFHNSTYTFGLVLTACLVGLALSAAIASWLAELWEPQNLAAYLCIFGALAIGTSVILFDRITHFRYFYKGETFVSYLLSAFGLVSMVVMPVMLTLGMLLPLAWKAARHSQGAGQVVGKLTAVNTIAATIGSLFASFLLLPWLDLWGSFAFIATCYLLLGAWLAWKTMNPVVGVMLLPAFLAVGIGLILPQEKYGLEKDEVILKRWNSPYGWIDVTRHKKSGNLRLRQDIHYGMGSSHSKIMELRQGHMPLLLHPNPQDVLFIGLATGVTASSALYHKEVKRTSVVELIPEVLPAAQLFRSQNKGIVGHPNVKIHINDGRHFLAATSRRFDVIVSDLFVPWQSQTGYLYTAEHYRMARKRLKKAGLFCQWMALWQVSARELEMIADTFASVFPHTTLWFSYLYPDHAILGLVGSNKPISLSMLAINRRLAGIARQSNPIDEVLTSATRLMHFYVGDWSRHPKHSLNLDEHPRVEFLAPISHWQGERIKDLTLKRYIKKTLFHLPRKKVELHTPSGLKPPTTKASRKWLFQRFRFE